jgi:DNA primase large subunit
VQAFDFHLPKPEPLGKSLKQKEDFSIPLQAVPETYFPPCIQNIAKGLQDGKKRALFVLVNFLTSAGWTYENIEAWLTAWNKRNPEPLRENLIVTHLRYHQQQQKKTMPPNCGNRGYMIGMGVCKPDTFCGATTPPGAENFSPRIKNPANYALKKQRLVNLTNNDNKSKSVKQTNTVVTDKEQAL